MPDLDELHRLAPDVDTAAAVAAFRRHRLRHRARSWRRGAFAVAAALVLVVGAVAVLALQDDDRPTAVVAGPPTEPGPVTAGPPTEPGPVAFEVLAVAEAVEPMGTLRAAADPATLDALWATSGAEGRTPSVDLDAVVVVSITIPDNACPPDLARFDREADAITPVFVEPPGACRDPLIPKTFVVAIDRASVEPAFTLWLPADGVYGFGEQNLRVDLAGSLTSEPEQATEATALEPSEPSCEAIEAVALSLVETGIDYDYEASDSPEDLFTRSEVVLVGALTGETEQRETGPDDSLTPARWFGVRVAVQATPKGTPETVDGVATVWIQHYGDHDLAAARALGATGTPVVVFADVHPEVGLQTAVEGIITACPGGPLIGQHVSTQGEWPTIATLDDLVARVEAAAG